MQFKVKRSRWTTTTCVKRMQKVANHIFSHYPKDSDLHRAFCEAWRSVDKAGVMAWSHMPKRSSVSRRRTSPKRRTTRARMWKRHPKRTARRSTPRRYARRRVMRRRAA
jgi:hypothetical protein